ncbi:glycosyltransferase family 4 protein [Candidatus Saccharibacteria bacterium]|nr:glycosyltransferase family 4 protein [Candidatus Saccharibacteria bacterium]
MVTLKIGFVLDDTLDSTDGVQQYILTLGAWLKAQGHDVHYLVGRTKRTDIENTHSFGKNVRVRFNRNRLSIPLPASPRKIYNFLVKEQFDVLHVQMPYSPMLAARIISLAPITTAIIGTFHVAPFSKFESAASRLLGFWLLPNAQKFDQVISVSQTAADFARKTFKLKSSIVPNPVDVDLYRVPPHVPKKPMISFVGRLVARKGAMHLVRALARMREEYPHMDFAARICGQGKDYKKLQRQIRKHNLQDYVWLEGYVSEEQKREYLASSTIAVFPATGGESFGIVLIEAMAAGAGVVLGGDNPGYRNVLGGVKECLIDPTDHRAFAKTMAQIITEPDHAKEIHAAQQAIIEQYDIKTVGPQILEAYNRAVTKRQQLL